ncbi:MAG: hypothetical protein K2I99_07895, partial [Bacteroidaceae bacterium]|nr:hypothetical protein [Bacteroidaceae bacterium]
VYYSCSNKERDDNGGNSVVVNKPQPLNLSIYLDLSDRINPSTDNSKALSQKNKDIAIVEYLANYVKSRAVKQKILPCKDKIKVFVYPIPDDSKIALLSEKLELDLNTAAPAEKKRMLTTFVDDFHGAMEQIYDYTIKTSKWQGSDIWGFFNKSVDNYCIKDGYRNVLVILTDGYIYHAQNNIQKGDAYSYVLPQTLKNPKSSLIAQRNGLEDLEVLMLELNPNPLTDQDKMEQVINDWLQNMGVQKYYVGETDLPSNTKMVIDKFLN